MRKIIRFLLFLSISLTVQNKALSQFIPNLFTSSISGEPIMLDTSNKNLVVFTNTLSCSACEKNLLLLLSDLNIDSNITITIIYSFGQDILQRRIKTMGCEKLLKRKCTIIFEDANYQTRSESFSNSVFLSSINAVGVPLLILLDSSKKHDLILYEKLFDETFVSDFAKLAIEAFIKK